MPTTRNASLLRTLAAEADDVASSVSKDKLPVLLRKLANRRRITAVAFQPLLVDAVLITHHQGFRVLFDSGQTDPDELNAKYQEETNERLVDTRLRFSLAHEFAHTLFYDVSSNPPKIAKQFRAGGGKTALDNLERNCDKLAGHLLLPTSLLENAIFNMKAITPESLRELARSAGVSLDALVRRFGSRSDLLRRRYFRGCIALVNERQDGLHVRAVAMPKHLTLARDLQVIRAGEKWQVATSVGTDIDLAAVADVSDVSLVTSSSDRGAAKNYRMHRQVVRQPASGISYLVVLEETDA
jgi:Zn-dependent peptidase ImmA (M78 family)